MAPVGMRAGGCGGILVPMSDDVAAMLAAADAGKPVQKKSTRPKSETETAISPEAKKKVKQVRETRLIEVEVSTHISDEQAIKVIELEEEVMAMRIQGISFANIEKKLGISDAQRVYKRAIQRRGNSEYMRAEAQRLESERLDSLQAGIWEKALKGDSRAVEVALKVLERRAKMFGLDFQDLVSARVVEIEEAKVKLMAFAFSKVMDHLGLSSTQQQDAMNLFIGELKAAEQAQHEI